MEPIHRIPIKALPNNATMIKVEIEQSQNRVINVLLMKFERWLLFLFHFRTHARVMDEMALRKLSKIPFRTFMERGGLGRERDIVWHATAFERIAFNATQVVHSVRGTTALAAAGA